MLLYCKLSNIYFIHRRLKKISNKYTHHLHNLTDINIYTINYNICKKITFPYLFWNFLRPGHRSSFWMFLLLGAPSLLQCSLVTLLWASILLVTSVVFVICGQIIFHLESFQMYPHKMLHRYNVNIILFTLGYSGSLTSSFYLKE